MTLREAGRGDMPAIASLYRHTMRTSLSFLPELHSPAEDLAFFRDKLLPQNAFWAAEEAGTIRGFIAFHDVFIEHLHVHPDDQGKGFGHALLEKAKSANPELHLWTFQQNARARAFYEARGFSPLRFTDGAGNEERMPDVLYGWKRDAAPNTNP
ncbi:MAG TPA: GNAT family N-acetyltransferase [Caulobacteraceae bacterium]